MVYSEQKYGPIAAWTERRLEITLQSVMRQAQGLCRMCVFIDGLDEFGGDQDALITLIAKVQTSSVKVCLSSRPYRSYNEAFGSSATLRLQDLTESDITTYVSDKLRAWTFEDSSEEKVSGVFRTIVDKAEGVFLVRHFCSHSSPFIALFGFVRQNCEVVS